MESRLKQMEADYNSSMSEFNKVDAQMKNRIRMVYKNQRTGMFELLLNAKDLNGLLDIIYLKELSLKMTTNV